MAQATSTKSFDYVGYAIGGVFATEEELYRLSPYATSAKGTMFVRSGFLTLAFEAIDISNAVKSGSVQAVAVQTSGVFGAWGGAIAGAKAGAAIGALAGDWAKAQKAEELHIHSTSGIDVERTDKLLRRLGFKTYGGNYSVAIR